MSYTLKSAEDVTIFSKYYANSINIVSISGFLELAVRSYFAAVHNHETSLLKLKIKSIGFQYVLWYYVIMLFDHVCLSTILEHAICRVLCQRRV
jgi:hypothetical protein